MTAILDQMDRLPTLVWAVVVMATAWLAIALAVAVMVGVYLTIGEVVSL